MSGMKKWKILFNIIMETVIFFGIAVLFSGNHCTCFAGTGGNRLSGSDKAWTGADGIIFRSARILCLCAEND